MGRKKTGETPVYSYRIRPKIAERLDLIYAEIKEDWTTVFESLLDKWEQKLEPNNCNTEKETVIQKSEGNKILDIFYEINKTIDYKKPFERRAADELIKQFGLERVEKVARFAVQIRGMAYAPSITKPSELKEKWAKLETFALAEKNKQSKNLNIGSITPS